MREGARGRATGRHWVVIETGANQAYIFASNRQAANIGASELVWQVGHRWVQEAVDDVLANGPAGRWVEPVVSASGKALLLVDRPETGREIIRRTTGRALAEAPGLDVWGVVDAEPIAGADDVGPALERAHHLHAAWRSRRPAGSLRHPTLPFTQPCRLTGLPATQLGREDDRWIPQAAAVTAALRARSQGRARMAAKFSDQAVVQPNRLNDGVDHDGWIAVMHADGNGIGEIFRGLASAYRGDEFLDRLRSFSTALDEVTTTALQRAIAPYPDRRDWLLPLIVGGDDVTLVMDARVAFEVTVGFVREFARCSAADDRIVHVLSRLRPAGGGSPAATGLTASAGIAYVRPHFAFSAAYDLAAELCAAAKQVKHVDPGCGALDFHVLHDAVGQPLSQLRADMTVPGPHGEASLRLWPGPIVIPTEAVTSDWAQLHSEAHLRKAIAGLSGAEEPPLSRTGLHLLRQALLHGGAAIERAEEQVLTWSPPTARDYLRQHLRVAEPDGGSFTRLLGAIELIDMATGTGRKGRDRAPQREEVTAG